MLYSLVIGHIEKPKAERAVSARNDVLQGINTVCLGGFLGFFPTVDFPTFICMLIVGFPSAHSLETPRSVSQSLRGSHLQHRHTDSSWPPASQQLHSQLHACPYYGFRPSSWYGVAPTSLHPPSRWPLHLSPPSPHCPDNVGVSPKL